MNKYLIMGAAALVVVIALVWSVYRLYKRVGRRCPRCGCLGVERIGKILLAPDESVSLYSPAGKRRWFIRRVVKLTFTLCQKCERIELVKIDKDPISLWHAFWAKWFHSQQYRLNDPALIEPAKRELRRLYDLESKRGKSDPRISDTPPLSLASLFEGYFKESGVSQGQGSK